MKTLNLKGQKITLEKLLKLAVEGSIRIVTPEGHTYVLEHDDEFDKEVQVHGKSKKLRKFLNNRSKEPATTSLEEYRRSLDRGC